MVQRHYTIFKASLEDQGKSLPLDVQREFEGFLECGRLEYGFLRVRCEDCHHERLVAFSCKRRGFCPSCGARRMAESAALLVDEVFPEVPIRQRVLSFPFQLRVLLVRYPDLMGRVLGIVNRTLSTYLINKAGYTFQPMDFIAKLAALVPKPRINLTRFHGVFTPNSKYRIQVTPSRRGKITAKAESGGVRLA